MLSEESGNLSRTKVKKFPESNSPLRNDEANKPLKYLTIKKSGHSSLFYSRFRSLNHNSPHYRKTLLLVKVFSSSKQCHASVEAATTLSESNTANAILEKSVKILPYKGFVHFETVL